MQTNPQNDKLTYAQRKFKKKRKKQRRNREEIYGELNVANILLSVYGI